MWTRLQYAWLREAKKCEIMVCGLGRGDIEKSLSLVGCYWKGLERGGVFAYLPTSGAGRGWPSWTLNMLTAWYPVFITDSSLIVDHVNNIHVLSLWKNSPPMLRETSYVSRSGMGTKWTESPEILYLFMRSNIISDLECSLSMKF